MLCMHLPMVNHIVCEKNRREVNLNADRKRLWMERLESVDNTQSNISLPLCLDIIPKMNL